MFCARFRWWLSNSLSSVIFVGQSATFIKGIAEIYSGTCKVSWFFFVALAYETPGWQEVVKTASDFVMYNAPRILGLSASGIIAFGVAGNLVIMR